MIKIEETNFCSNKIIDFSTAAKKISKLKKSKNTVGLCHGGFDLLHPGHIKHLESAAELCNYLFVSVTSDRFVESRKGNGRPIFSAKLRAYSIASLEYVDYVVISDFEQATDVLDKLKPSYYIKGPDFANKTTPGITAEKNKIKTVGGKIKYTADQKLSTTGIIKYIQENVKREKVLLGIDRDGTLIEYVKFIGKNKHWKGQIKLKKEVIDLLSYIQTKCDTTKVVISNQQGVARGYFGIKTVESINKHIDRIMQKKNIIIDNWQYCPDVDIKYAKLMGNVKFKANFVKNKTKRKPNPDMLLGALKKLHKKLGDFDKIIIIGDGQDDADMAKNINGIFLDVNDKTYLELKNEFNNI